MKKKDIKIANRYKSIYGNPKDYYIPIEFYKLSRINRTMVKCIFVNEEASYVAIVAVLPSELETLENETKEKEDI